MSGKKKAKVSRREFLAAAGAAGVGLAAGGLDALGQLFARSSRTAKGDLDEYDFLMPRVRFSCDDRVGDVWNVYPGADRNLLSELSSTIRCKVKLPTGCGNERPHYGSDDQFNAVVGFDDYDRIRDFPFLFMTAEGYFKFDAAQIDNVRRYLSEGGFILMDDCVFDKGGDFFYRSACDMLEQAMGAGSVVPIPYEHEVFHNVFDFGGDGLPHMQGQKHGARGVFLGDRLGVFVSPSDIHCGWATPGWFGAEGQKRSIQMGINVIMYALAH
ncbi:MAG: DUF4159 domain-containing protein [Phycisphaerae bacterium]|nr:DUF4159 domain-containing protein [Phycisphaerae bacterium]